ncbi:hypothetical protein BJ170DRAFT_605721 [Xylariales sp. AK1849]|nr:hypothetical protein BJ170DRAFT_605721 [Xylariales sp. AK1849]
MSDDASSPLLPAATAKNKAAAQERHESGETTPLLSSSADTPRYDGEHDGPDRDAAASIRSRHSDAISTHSTKKSSRRWPSFIAMGILGIIMVVIIALAFIVPDAVQEYAKQAAVVEPTNLSLDSITTDGVKARIQANFHLDGSRVANDHVRRVGRAATWVANQLATEETKVAVSLPDYDNIVLGTAVIPSLVINLRDGYTTSFDFVTDIAAGDVEGIRSIANEWLEGRLERLRLKGTTDLTLHSGLLPLGTHNIAESLVFEANKIPAMPQYNITRLIVKDVPSPGDTKSMVADVSLSAHNDYPVELDIPELAFEIMVPGCDNHDPYIIVADAVTSEVLVKPRTDVGLDVHGLIRELPDSLTRACPNSNASPLDLLLKQYMNGEPATLFVRGSSRPDGSTPRWIADILSSITLPVPFPGRSLDGLIRNFSLTDVHFTMPDPFADKDDPDSNPKVSGNILVTAGLPSEMNFGINVTKVRAFADVFYKTKKLGELNLEKWQNATSTKVEETKGQEATLKIESRINDAPLNVTDSDVLSDVIQTLMFRGKPIRLDIKAAVDVKVETVLGQLILKDVPAEGKIPVKPFSNKDSLHKLAPKVRSLRILDTTSNSITLQALVNVTNPTLYTAHVPFINVHVMSNGSVLGEATVENADVVKGVNSNLLVTAKWKPSLSGRDGLQIGRDLISQYISGFNTSITVKAHRDSIPGQRILCEALSRFNVTFPTPKFNLPGDTPEERSHFIRDATFHFFSSTATFTLVSPLHYNSLYIDFVNATALYNHTEPIGKILHDLPFQAPPGKSQTPKLPVEWSVGSVGYDAVRKALGGKLRLDAHATVDIRLGNWKESLWYEGRGIGASIQL